MVEDPPPRSSITSYDTTEGVAYFVLLIIYFFTGNITQLNLWITIIHTPNYSFKFNPTKTNLHKYTTYLEFIGTLWNYTMAYNGFLFPLGIKRREHTFE
ncbi:hypothetical protein AAFF_G00234910, partial [Aldrovandia affinis]